MKFYSGVPQAPPARRNRLDQNLYQAQKKAENALHLLIHTVETDDFENLHATSAWVRSLWQDLQEIRRHLLAGDTQTLDPRPDLTTSRLLTKEEEQRLRQKHQQSQHRGRGRAQSRPPQNRPRSRSNFRNGKGEGKGKGGKGKGNQE